MMERIVSLAGAFGAAPDLEEIRDLILAALRPLGVTATVDALGSVIAQREGSGSRVLLTARMDQPGIIVVGEEEGKLRVEPTGGLKPAPGLRLRFRQGGFGVLAGEQGKGLDGHGPGVAVGAAAVPDAPIRAAGDWICGPAAASRTVCALALAALADCGERALCVAFTGDEAGAGAAAWSLRPELALTLGVADAGGMGAARPGLEPGKGPAVRVMDDGFIAHPGLRQGLVRAAAAAGVPHQLEVVAGSASPGPGALQTSCYGVPTGGLSLPCRYRATPGELLHLADVRAARALLAAWLAGEALG